MGWSDYAASLETAIDNIYGEAITILPYKSGGYLGSFVPDQSRSSIDAVGYTVSKQTMVNAPGNAFVSKRLEADNIIKVQSQYMSGVQQHDRVLFRGETFEISYIEQNTNNRPVLHLIKVHT